MAKTRRRSRTTRAAEAKDLFRVTVRDASRVVVVGEVPEPGPGPAAQAHDDDQGESR